MVFNVSCVEKHGEGQVLRLGSVLLQRHLYRKQEYTFLIESIAVRVLHAVLSLL